VDENRMGNPLFSPRECFRRAIEPLSDKLLESFS
jgi:hypothetical protein